MEVIRKWSGVKVFVYTTNERDLNREEVCVSDFEGVRKFVTKY